MARAGVSALALMASLAFACGDGGVTSPDASDGDGGAGGADAGEGVSALVLEWKTDPALDDSPTGPLDLVVTRAEFYLEDLRAVGDAAVLTRSSFDLVFGGEGKPTVRYAPAAPGLYSSLIGRIHRYDIAGTIVVDSETYELRIHEEPRPEPSFDISMNERVLPGMTTTVKLEIEIGHIVEEIDWSTVDLDEGILDVDHEFARIADVREEIVDAFQLD